MLSAKEHILLENARFRASLQGMSGRQNRSRRRRFSSKLTRRWLRNIRTWRRFISMRRLNWLNIIRRWNRGSISRKDKLIYRDNPKKRWLRINMTRTRCRTRRSRKLKKRKDIFNKPDMTREINLTCRWTPALIAFVMLAITNKHTLSATKFKFVCCIRLNPQEALAAKRFESKVVRLSTKKFLIRRYRIIWKDRKTINEIQGCVKRLNPKELGKLRLSKKSEGNFNQMSVFSFYNTILLRCISIALLMKDSFLLKKLSKLSARELTTTISSKYLNW